MRTCRDVTFICAFPVLPSFNSFCNLFDSPVIFAVIQRVLKWLSLAEETPQGRQQVVVEWHGRGGRYFGAARVSAHPCLPDSDMNIIGTAV